MSVPAVSDQPPGAESSHSNLSPSKSNPHTPNTQDPPNIRHAHNFLSLPPEILHQIYAHLPLHRLLSLLLAVSPSPSHLTYLDAAFLTHPTWFPILFPPPPKKPTYSSIVSRSKGVTLRHSRGSGHNLSPRSKVFDGAGWSGEYGVVHRFGSRARADFAVPVLTRPVYVYPAGGGPEIWQIKRRSLSNGITNKSSVAYRQAVEKEDAAEAARAQFLIELKTHFAVYLQVAILSRKGNNLQEVIDELNLRDISWLGRKGVKGEMLLFFIKNTLIRERLRESGYEYFLPVYRRWTLGGLAEADDWNRLLRTPPNVSDIPVHRTADLGKQGEFPLPTATQDWDYYHLPSQWLTLRSAERRLMLHKASQLRRLAGLISLYPGLLRLGMTCSQDPPRPSRDKHDIRKLLLSAGKLESENYTEMWGHNWVARYIFRRTAFPLVPLDRLLRGFIKVLTRYPIPPNDVCFSSEDEWCPPSGEVCYPPDISSTLRMVISRMAYYTVHPTLHRDYIFTVPPKNVIPKSSASTENKNIPHFLGSTLHKHPVPLRTLNTPFSAPAHRDISRHRQPKFLGCEVEDAPAIHHTREWWDSDECVRYLMPLVDEEFEWLERFMECVEWFGRWEGRRWDKGGDKGISVGEWWRRHVLA